MSKNQLQIPAEIFETLILSRKLVLYTNFAYEIYSRGG